MEYNHARVYANSLGLQAVVERSTADSSAGPFDLSAIDYTFVSAVVDGCSEILKITTSPRKKDSLRYGPVSVFLRITSASVFLLKGLGVGVHITKLREALNVLTHAITTLKASKPDDLHLGARYAALLETHVVRLQESFVPAAKPAVLSSRPPPVEHPVQFHSDIQAIEWNPSNSRAEFTDIGYLPFEDSAGGFDESWLTLPFDPSLMPFAADESQEFQGLGDDSLNFIWNLEH